MVQRLRCDSGGADGSSFIRSTSGSIAKFCCVTFAKLFIFFRIPEAGWAGLVCRAKVEKGVEVMYAERLILETDIAVELPEHHSEKLLSGF